jgi:hypothetical protein
MALMTLLMSGCILLEHLREKFSFPLKTYAGLKTLALDLAQQRRGKHGEQSSPVMLMEEIDAPREAFLIQEISKLREYPFNPQLDLAIAERVCLTKLLNCSSPSRSSSFLQRWCAWFL